MIVALRSRDALASRVVVQIVEEGCDAIGNKGYNIHTGYGRVNFGKSLKLAQGWGK